MGKSKKPQVSEEELNRRHQRFVFVIDSIKKVLLAAIWAGALFGIIYVSIYLPVLASNGKETIVTVSLTWLADLKLDVILGWSFGGAGILYGKAMHSKLKRERVAKDSRITELEKAIDPTRTSSELDPSGNPANKKGRKP